MRTRRSCKITAYYDLLEWRLSLSAFPQGMFAPPALVSGASVTLSKAADDLPPPDPEPEPGPHPG
jgi:hypothetical protein